MTSSLSNLVNNFSEWIHRIQCKNGHNDKKCETCRIKYKYCKFFLECMNFKDNLIEYKCLCCNKIYQHKFEKKWKKWFFNAYKFFNHENDKFVSFLRKVFILMNIYGWFGKTHWNIISWKGRFYIRSIMEILLMQITRTLKEL